MNFSNTSPRSRFFTRANHAVMRFVVFCIPIFFLFKTITAFGVEEFHIALLVNGENVVHSEIVAGLRKRFAELERPQFEISMITLDEQRRVPIEKLVSNRFDLLVAIGGYATKAAIESQSPLPVLSLLAPESAVAAILADSRPAEDKLRQEQFSAIYVDQPPARQMRFIKNLLPKARSVGVVLGQNRLVKRRELEAAAEQNNLQINIADVSNSKTIVEDIRKVVSQSDVMLAVYDPVIIDSVTARWLLYSSYQYRVPVIGFSHAFVRAGALASVVSSPRLVGKQAAEMIDISLGKGRWKTNSRHFPKYFEIDLNRRLAKTLVLDLPEPEVLSAGLRHFVGNETP